MDGEFKHVCQYMIDVKDIWYKWLECMRGKAGVAKLDTGAFIITLCNAVLLEIGPPPHPEFITVGVAAAIDAELKLYTQMKGNKALKNRYDDAVRAQWKWNREFNDWAISRQLYGISKAHGPAQFRKFFAAWWLLYREASCEQAKEKKAGKTVVRFPVGAAAEMAAIRNALAKRERLVHRTAGKARKST